MSRVGIFSGTFDPVHRGHLAFAHAAADQAQLDTVVLLPERIPRNKAQASDFAHRERMVRLAAAPYDRLQVLALADDQFTVAGTLPQLQQRYAGDQLVFLIGSDVVRSFGPQWPGLAELLRGMELAIGLRAGEHQQDVYAMLQQLGLPCIAQFVQSSHRHVSATKVRGGDFASIEPSVHTYIAQHQLYTA